MIVVDTNIISEVMRPQPDPAVIQWLDQQETFLLYLTTITLAEIRYGLGILPDGERKQRLINRFEAYVDGRLKGAFWISPQMPPAATRTSWRIAGKWDCR